MQTIEQKLEAVESSLRRWHSRLTRASNAIRKLEAKRRRLLTAKPEPKRIEPPIETRPTWHVPDKPRAIEPPVIRSDDPDLAEKVAAALKQSRGDDLSVPAFLARPAADLDTMTATRKAVEAAERKKMPLSGREALAAIREASAKVSAKRAKKELRPRP